MISATVYLTWRRFESSNFCLAKKNIYLVFCFERNSVLVEKCHNFLDPVSRVLISELLAAVLVGEADIGAEALYLLIRLICRLLQLQKLRHEGRLILGGNVLAESEKGLHLSLLRRPGDHVDDVSVEPSVIQIETLTGRVLEIVADLRLDLPALDEEHLEINTGL